MDSSWHRCGNVYIVFGDSSRPDGSNIDGVYCCEEDAIASIELNKKYYDPTKEYTCQRRTVWGRIKRGDE